MRFIADGSELWWDIRPSHTYPTIELRICDVCPRVRDAVSIAALFACLVRRLARLDGEGALPPEPLTELIAEDRWTAQRYGVFAFFGDAGSGSGRVDIEDRLAVLVEELVPDARALGCEAEVARVKTIVREGTGADRQIDHYRLRLLEGDSEQEALRSVVDLMLAETTQQLRQWLDWMDDLDPDGETPADTTALQASHPGAPPSGSGARPHGAARRRRKRKRR